MKKVLFISTVDFTDNAVTRVITGLRNGIGKYGWDSIFAVGRHCKTGSADIVIGNSIDSYVHALGSRLFDTEGRHSEGSTKDFISSISRLDIDLIHIHNLHGHYFHYPTLFKWVRCSKTPIIITLHDTWLLTGHCTTYYHQGCNVPYDCQTCKKSYNEYPWSWRISQIFGQRKENLRLKRELIFENENIQFVTVSDWLRNEVIKTGLTDNVITIHNGIDCEIFHPKKKLCGEGFKILFITHNWESWKCLESVIEFSKHLHIDETITLVGNIYGKKLPDNIRHIENISDINALLTLYNEHDLLISPSLAETFGMTVLEAMSCGLPVIVNNSAALPEIVSNSAGLITDTSNMLMLRNAVDTVRADYSKYTPSEYAKSSFSDSIMCKKYAELYKMMFYNIKKQP